MNQSQKKLIKKIRICLVLNPSLSHALCDPSCHRLIKIQISKVLVNIIQVVLLKALSIFFINSYELINKKHIIFLLNF